MDAEEESPSPIPRQEVQDEIVDVEEEYVLPRLEDVGLPPDEIWDHDAAYDRRFCFNYGE